MSGDPLFAVVDEPWFEIDAHLNVGVPLTRAATALCPGLVPVGRPLRELLAPLLSGDDLAAVLAAAREAAGPRTLEALAVALPAAPGRAAATRFFELRLQPGATAGTLLLGFRDVTELRRQRAALEHAQSNAALALALLAAEPARLRECLASASASVATIRSLLQLPARDAASLRHKVGRIQAEVRRVREAQHLGLGAIADAAHAFESAVAALGGQDACGDDFLPLAARLNDLFAQVNAAVAMSERRTAVPQPPASAAPRHPRAFEAGLRSFVETLANRRELQLRLVMIGLEHLPAPLEPAVDGLLRHLLADTLEHRLESPAQRLEAGKPAAATLTVQLAKHASMFELLVQDDGRGFEGRKLGRAAVARGLGPVMDFLREGVTRLGGRITVATHERRYTRYRILLPATPRASRTDARQVSVGRQRANRALP